MFKYKYIGRWLLVLVFFFSLISVPNIGHNAGIQAPYNLALYGGVVLFIVFTLFNSLNVLSFQFSYLILFSALAAISIVVIGFLNSSFEEVEYTIYALLVGFLFIVSLVQYQLDDKHWFWFFYAIILLALAQVCISLVQRFDTFGVLYWWTGYFPFKFHSGYLGSLQQRNMLASFIAFAVVVGSWLVVQQRFLNLKVVVKLPVYAVIFFGVFIIVDSGSRAALLGLIIGLIFLLFALRENIQSNLKCFVQILFLVILGVVVAILLPADVSSAGSKLVGVVYGSDVRLFLYESGWQLFLQNLWFGVGIGNYPIAFQEFVSLHGLFLDKRIIDFNVKNFTHPHNELLFWLIQIGIVGCLPILLGVSLLLRNWWKQGQKQFWLYIALSFPLVLQVMVSYPLILSATHYFLILVFLVYSLKQSVKTLDFNIPKFVVGITRSTLLILGLWVVYSVYAGLMSAFETYYFKNRLFFYKDYPKQETIGYFHYASNWDLYQEIVLLNMENLFLKAKKDNNMYDLDQYLLWFNKQKNNASLPKKFKSYADEAERILQNKGIY